MYDIYPTIKSLFILAFTAFAAALGQCCESKHSADEWSEGQTNIT